MRKGILFIVLAAALWGLVPALSRGLYAMGTDPLAVAAARCYISAVVYLGIGLFTKSMPRLNIRQALYFAVVGLCSVVGPFSFYGLANQHLSSAMAAMLLYTAPAFVILFSRVIYKEPITKVKLVALACIFLGCFLVVRGYDLGSLQVNALGIFFGLMAGICYASLTLFTRKSLTMFSARINTTLAHLFASVFFFLIRPVWVYFPLTPGKGLGLLAVGIIGSTLPYLLYTQGMESGVEGGDASLLSSLEPIVAAVLGVILFADPLDWPQVLGIVLTLCGASLPVVIARRLGKLEGLPPQEDEEAVQESTEHV